MVSLPKNVYVYMYCILVKRCEINKEFVTLHRKTGITGTRAMTRHARSVIEHINRQKRLARQPSMWYAQAFVSISVLDVMLNERVT